MGSIATCITVREDGYLIRAEVRQGWYEHPSSRLLQNIGSVFTHVQPCEHGNGFLLLPQFLKTLDVISCLPRQSLCERVIIMLVLAPCPTLPKTRPLGTLFSMTELCRVYSP